MKDLIEAVPGGLSRYCPEVHYLLLDEGQYQDSELAPLRNIVAALFRLEKSRTPEDITRMLENLTAWLGSPQQGEATVLLRQIELKFGALDNALRQRIASASVKQLRTWQIES